MCPNSAQSLAASAGFGAKWRGSTQFQAKSQREGNHGEGWPEIWLEVGQEEQERRFLARMNDPLRQWKLSPMDLESFRRWYDYSRARDMMLQKTDSKHAPWHVVRSDDKRRARLNCISHILKRIPSGKVSREKVKLQKRSGKGKYDDQASLKERKLIPERY